MKTDEWLSVFGEPNPFVYFCILFEGQTRVGKLPPSSDRSDRLEFWFTEYVRFRRGLRKALRTGRVQPRTIRLLITRRTESGCHVEIQDIDAIVLFPVPTDMGGGFFAVRAIVGPDSVAAGSGTSCRRRHDRLGRRYVRGA